MPRSIRYTYYDVPKPQSEQTKLAAFAIKWYRAYQAVCAYTTAAHMPQPPLAAVFGTQAANTPLDELMIPISQTEYQQPTIVQTLITAKRPSTIERELVRYAQLKGGRPLKAYKISRDFLNETEPQTEQEQPPLPFTFASFIKSAYKGADITKELTKIDKALIDKLNDHAHWMEEG